MLTIYDRKFFDTVGRHEGARAPTAAQEAALNAFEAAAESDEFRFDMMLEAGDVQLVHNHTIVHSRSAFYDPPGAPLSRRRHLLRLWLSLGPELGWTLPASYAEGRYANIDRAGGAPVGGIVPAHSVRPTIPLEPE